MWGWVSTAVTWVVRVARWIVRADRAIDQDKHEDCDKKNDEKPDN